MPIAFPISIAEDRHQTLAPSQCGNTMRPHSQERLHLQRLALLEAAAVAFMIGLSHLHAPEYMPLALPLSQMASDLPNRATFCGTPHLGISAPMNLWITSFVGEG